MIFGREFTPAIRAVRQGSCRWLCSALALPLLRLRRMLPRAATEKRRAKKAPLQTTRDRDRMIPMRMKQGPA